MGCQAQDRVLTRIAFRHVWGPCQHDPARMQKEKILHALRMQYLIF